MDKIINYICQKYEPLSIIVYGSYADGSNNENSDFDALVISGCDKEYHDVSFVDGIQLDVFVYPLSHFDEAFDCEEIIQIFDGKVVMDTDGCGLALKNRVLTYIENLPGKTEEEISAEIEWCRKMFLRTKREDAEGMFRWHWLLIDSLEIFCDVMHYPYRGPKKSLRWMKNEYPEAFACYTKALYEFDTDTTARWIDYLSKMVRTK